MRQYPRRRVVGSHAPLPPDLPQTTTAAGWNREQVLAQGTAAGYSEPSTERVDAGLRLSPNALSLVWSLWPAFTLSRSLTFTPPPRAEGGGDHWGLRDSRQERGGSWAGAGAGGEGQARPRPARRGGPAGTRSPGLASSRPAATRLSLGCPRPATRATGALRIRKRVGAGPGPGAGSGRRGGPGSARELRPQAPPRPRVAVRPGC